MEIKAFCGDGPGPQAKDGCSVELYRRLPYAGEITVLSHLLSPNCSVLELGCGTGRLTSHLLSRGCDVTAVDNSVEMLAYAPAKATLVNADIEHLNLKQKFDVVLLPTCLINHADPAVRAAFINAAARHVKPFGRFVLERHDPVWLSTAKTGFVGRMQDISSWIDFVARSDDVIEMTIRYADEFNTWRHSFSLVALDDASLQSALDASGFGEVTWLDARRRWAAVRLKNDCRAANENNS